MTEQTNYFTCPKCGGHYFGTDVQTNEVQCHNRKDGQPFVDFDAWLAAGKPKQQKACGWKGQWPQKGEGDGR